MINFRIPIARSFRDSAGFVFEEDGKIYRQINIVGKVNYDTLMRPGLYYELTEFWKLIPREAVSMTWIMDKLSF